MTFLMILCCIIAGIGALVGAKFFLAATIYFHKAFRSGTSRGNKEENKKKCKTYLKKSFVSGGKALVIVIISILIALPFVPK